MNSKQHTRFSPEVNSKLGANISKNRKVETLLCKKFGYRNIFNLPTNRDVDFLCVQVPVPHAIFQS